MIRILFFCSLCLLGCTQEKFQDYETTLDLLKLNYAQYYKKMEAENALDLYFEFYSISSEDDHKRRYALYNEGLYRFYHSDKGMIDFLLGFRGSQCYNQWLFLDESPLSSRIKVSDLLTESEAALVLLDYFLRGKNTALNAKKYSFNLTYDNFQSFYEKHRYKTLNQIRKQYKKQFPTR